MKIVLDTNVIVSGLLKPFSVPAGVVQMVSSGTLELYYDARILTEYRSVLLRPKFPFSSIYVDALLEQIKARGMSVSAEPLNEHLPDIHDKPFLEVALTGQAEYLVTGNLKHFPPHSRHGIHVVAPDEFLKVYRKK